MEIIKSSHIYGPLDASYLKVYLENPQDTQRFLGHGSFNKAGYVNVENNIVNRILLGIYEPKDYVPPKIGIRGLKDYQQVDVEHIRTIQNVLNRNPMGLGKTVETVVALREMNITQALIIVPKPVISQWVEAFSIWYKEAKVSTKVGTNGIVITNYEQVSIPRNLNVLKNTVWQYIILDEAHRIKNRKSKRTLAIKSLPSLRRMALTGTPVLRRIDDLWSILNFLDWKYSGLSYWNFVYYFCEITETFWGKQITGVTQIPERVELLNALLKECSVYNQLEVAQGKNIFEVPLEMDKPQRTLYNNIRKLVLDELPEDCTIPNGAVCTMRLRQTTTYPGMIDKAKSEFYGVKFEWIFAFLEDHPDVKVCVFTKFEKAADALWKALVAKKIDAVQITGKISTEDRIVNKRIFQENKNIQCLIGTIDAIGQGFDGLQDICNVGIFLDKDFSPEINKQVEARLHRMGQQKPVFLYYLTCKKSFDERVGRINMSKSKDIRIALESEAEK